MSTPVICLGAFCPVMSFFMGGQMSGRACHAYIEINSSLPIFSPIQAYTCCAFPLDLKNVKLL